MHKKILTIVSILLVLVIVNDSLNSSIQSSSSGAPVGYAGSPFDNGGSTCNACHSGGSFSPMVSVTSTIPASGYVAGTTYQFTATVSAPGASRFGFQTTAQGLGGVQLGTLISTSGQTQLLSGSKYITHTSAGNSGSGTKTWTFSWTAPNPAAGTVPFFSAFVAANSNNQTSGDVVSISTLLFSPAVPPMQTSTSQTNVSCNGLCNGSATVSVTGGTAPYNFVWNTNPTQNGATANNLCPGTYVVAIVDANFVATSDTVVITEPSVLSSSGNTIDVTCSNGNGGAIDLTVSGGTVPYSYLWSNGSTTQDLNNISAGSYTVLVNDANGCQLSDTFTINQPSNAISAIISSNNISCNGENDGSASVSISGGTPPYEIIWNNGAITDSISLLPAGTYTVFINDNNNCSAQLSVTITEPSPLSFSHTSTPASCSACNDGTLTINPSGGTLPYTIDIGVLGTSPFLNLLPDDYVVIITDANLCEYIDTVNVSFLSSIFENLSETNLKLYPNPANESIKLEGSFNNNNLIKIYSAYGKLMDVLYFQNNNFIQNINVSSYPSGVYIVNVGIKNLRFIKN